jgi:hypothetical protein
VFKVGIALASRGSIPKGGQRLPNSTAGDSEECKYPQKIKEKKIISVNINKVIPKINPFITTVV